MKRHGWEVSDGEMTAGYEDLIEAYRMLVGQLDWYQKYRKAGFNIELLQQRVREHQARFAAFRFQNMPPDMQKQDKRRRMLQVNLREQEDREAALKKELALVKNQKAMTNAELDGLPPSMDNT